MLLTLPLELRLEIYEQILADARHSPIFISCSEDESPETTGGEDSSSSATNSEHANQLWTILLTSRQVRAEFAPLLLPHWTAHVTFSAPSTTRLTMFLNHVRNVNMLPYLRNIQVTVSPPSTTLHNTTNTTQHSSRDFRHVLPRFPGLALDVLEICPDLREGQYDTYAELDALIRMGKGWRKLRYHLPATSYLWCREQDAGREGKRRVPVLWNAAVRTRDGEASGAKVRLEAQRKGEVERVVVIVTRGRGVDIVEDGRAVEMENVGDVDRDLARQGLVLEGAGVEGMLLGLW